MPADTHSTPPITFVGIGEVLFDVFEDGAEALGGAPLNVAVHAHQLAAPLALGEGIVVSAVGADARGERLVSALRARGMSVEYVATGAQHPTGLVSVFLRDGEPGYQIAAPSAWDDIAPSDSLDRLAARCHAVCFGSLAQRSAVSRATIRRFLERARRAVRLYDVNLRRNTLTGEEGYSAEIIDTSCRLATIIKANAAELVTVSKLLGIGASLDQSPSGLRRRMELLLERFPAELIVLTRAGEGTLLFTHNGETTVAVDAIPRDRLHPVGAGDASSAGILFGLALGWDEARAVELANRMGAWVAAQPPATPPLSESLLNYVRDAVRTQTLARP
jgi:fructokinase